MILLGYELGMDLKCHKELVPYLDVHTTFELSDQEKEAFLAATFLLAAHKDFHKIRRANLKLIFTNKNEVTFQFQPGNLASVTNYAFFNCSEIQKFNQAQKIIIYLEELVHHFWDEFDEMKTKGIVCEMAPQLVKYDYGKDKYIFL